MMGSHRGEEGEKGLILAASLLTGHQHGFITSSILSQCTLISVYSPANFSRAVQAHKMKHEWGGQQSHEVEQVRKLCSGT